MNNYRILYYMVDSEYIYKYLGLAVVIVFVIIFINRCLRLQYRIIEQMSNNNDSNDSSGESNDTVANLAQKVLEKGQELEDRLLIEKYKDDYEDLILNMDKTISMAQIQLLKDAADEGIESRNANFKISKINTFETLRNSLNNMIKTLDKKPSSGGLF